MEAQIEWHGSECDAADFGWDFWPRKLPILSRCISCSRNIVNLSCVYMNCRTYSFSSMKRLNSPLRSTMTDERLSSLAIPHIHKHKNVDWQVGYLITEFARLKGRRLAICLWPVVIVFVQLTTAFLPDYLLKMPRRKTRRWHFRDPKFQNFLGEHAPRPP